MLLDCYIVTWLKVRWPTGEVFPNIRPEMIQKMGIAENISYTHFFANIKIMERLFSVVSSIFPHLLTTDFPNDGSMEFYINDKCFFIEVEFSVVVRSCNVGADAHVSCKAAVFLNFGH